MPGRRRIRRNTNCYDGYVARLNAAEEQYNVPEQKRLAQLAKAEAFKDFLQSFVARESVLTVFGDALRQRRCRQHNQGLSRRQLGFSPTGKPCLPPLPDTVTIYRDGKLI